MFVGIVFAPFSLVVFTFIFIFFKKKNASEQKKEKLISAFIQNKQKSYICYILAFVAFLWH